MADIINICNRHVFQLTKVEIKVIFWSQLVFVIAIFGDEAPEGSVFVDGIVNSGRSSLQDEFREDRSKSVAVPETIDAVRQLIFKDRHAIYREMETTLGISGTSIQSILYEYLTVKKKFVRVGSHTIFQSLRKRLVSVGRKKCCKNTTVVIWNTSMTSWQVLNSGFMRMSQKVSSSRLYGCFKVSQIQQKLVEDKALPSTSEKLYISQSHQWNNVEQSILSAT